MPNDRDRDYHEGLDGLQADMAEHQRAFRGEVTAESNRQLAAAAIERLEKENADRKPEPAPPPPPAPPVIPITARKDRDGRQYIMRKEADRGSLLRKASPVEAEFMVKAQTRIEKLLTLRDSGPLGAASWRDRVLAVMSTKAKASSWKAAADAPEQLAHSRATLQHDQKLLKVLGLETISQLTPEFCRAKAAELERQYLAEFLQLLEDSNALGFGDWKNDAPTTTKLTVA